jgi:hypothetical protein
MKFACRTGVRVIRLSEVFAQQPKFPSLMRTHKKPRFGFACPGRRPFPLAEGTGSLSLNSVDKAALMQTHKSQFSALFGQNTVSS